MDDYDLNESYDDHIVDCLGSPSDHRDYRHDDRHDEYDLDDSYEL